MSNLELIKQLRERTGAGMNDCQKALAESGDDMELAVENLRKNGLEKAAKKADRTVKEGLIAQVRQGNKIATVALACETDFVARNEDFVKAANTLAEKLMQTTNLDAFNAEADSLIKNELVIKIGENLQLKAAEVMSGEVLGVYLHANKKVAAVVVMSGGTETLANDLAMQVAAMMPKYLTPTDVPNEVIEKEKEIYREQLRGEGKPEAIWDKIIEGKLNKFYEEVCLTNQYFVKEDKTKVSDLLVAAGAEVKIIKFARYAV